MKWKILIETTVFKADGSDLTLPVDTILKLKDGIFTVGDDVIIITLHQIEQNSDTYELQASTFTKVAVSKVTKEIRIEFDKTIPTLTQDQKDVLGNIVEIWLNQNHG